ncbi:protein MpMTPSL3 [Marchantia polymorpha subsp. ruderalis]|uniref:Terpene synthase n=2 Tax=Marchantia polymorpha TaxID=3197 RepID=A0AAF6B6F3_MARPO|nr:hypothetical protein MARPO_0150s0003 [Marchantia polymorpha]BBN07587.1 hypothetical protein Mp_4g04780 [Marchantia polymorpha subsp. ruderalis]|eukprot:PTQ28979.1 hypothetical protein MARPO_0150s0003 [Marchantia polymorpha]
MAPLHSASTVLSIRSDFRQGQFRGQLKSELYRNGSRNSYENVYRIPHFQNRYPKAQLNPLTPEYTDIANDWLVSFGVDKELGPSLWTSFVAAKSPELIGYVFYNDVEPRDFLWLCKFVAFIFAFDTKMDESDWTDAVELSCDMILEMSLLLLWNDPENERLLERLNSILDRLMATEASRERLQDHTVHADLVHARNKSKSLLDVKMGAFASALRDLWLEYIEAVPAEFVSREAEIHLDYLSACLWEQKNRKTREEITIPDFIILRRSAGGLMPFVVCTDLIIEHKRQKYAISHLPNSIFYGNNMQNLLAASADCVAWHNDTFSFEKEIYRDGDLHNLVEIVSRHYNCHSHTQAGELVIELLHDRIAEMELVYENLKSEASPEFHPAIDRYMKSCRDWIAGTHEFHLTSVRYKNSNSLSELR